jgi:hypothetical protein
MNMVEEHDHLSNHWLEEKGMNIASIHMVEDMDMIKKRPSNHRSEDRGKNFVEEHSSNHWSKVKDFDMVEVVEREHHETLAR